MLPDRVSNPGSLTYETGALPAEFSMWPGDHRRDVLVSVLVQMTQSVIFFLYDVHFSSLTLLHSEQPKLYRVLAVLSAIGLSFFT